MSDFELAMQEFLDNGGVIETLEYKGPKESEVVFSHRKNVSRSKDLVPEEVIDRLIDEDEAE
jgi:hypothetical protein